MEWEAWRRSSLNKAGFGGGGGGGVRGDMRGRLRHIMGSSAVRLLEHQSIPETSALSALPSYLRMRLHCHICDSESKLNWENQA